MDRFPRQSTADGLRGVFAVRNRKGGRWVSIAVAALVALAGWVTACGAVAVPEEASQGPERSPAGELGGDRGLVEALDKAMAEAMPPPVAGAFSVRTADGLALVVDRHGIVRQGKVGGRELPTPADTDIGGFWAWDVSQPVKFLRFLAAGGRGKTLELKCQELGLRMAVRVRAAGRAVVFDCELADERGEDRGVVVVWAMPLDAQGWLWGDDLTRARPIAAPGLYENTVAYGPQGQTGQARISVYPWAAVASDKLGLMVARPLDRPRLAAFFYRYDEGVRYLAARFYLGLSPTTKKFPSRASFSFLLSALPQPQWGFRAACARYYELFPQFFQRRVKREGIWHLNINAAVELPEDFALVFHEQEPYSEHRVEFDDKHGGLSVTYSEPNTIWQHTKAWGEGEELDLAAFMRELERRAGKPLSELTKYPFYTLPKGVPDAEIARAVLNSYIGEPGRPSVFVRPGDRVAVNCNGDPELGRPCRASLWFDYEGKPALQDRRVDGAYVDSVGFGGFDAAMNRRREHWATADVPLVADFGSGKCGQLAGFAHYELYAAIAHAMHERGKIVLANTFPWAHQFVAHLFDVLGAGESAQIEGLSDLARLGFCRALAYHKPVAGMNYAYLRRDVSLADKERAMQRALVYCAWPGTGDGADLKALEAVRPLYRKYMPIFRTLAEAGWEPVPYVHAWPREVVVERYGKIADGVVYLVVHNAGERPVLAQVAIGGVASPLQRRVTDMVSGKKVPVRGGKVAIEMEPRQTAVFKVHTGSGW